MRLVLAAAALAAFALPALAQGQPARPPAGQRPPAAQQQPQPPEPPPIFLCRTAEEVCTLGIVTGNNQIVVIFTNAPGAEGVAKPIDVSSGDGSPLDLSQNMGRVVLLDRRLRSQDGADQGRTGRGREPACLDPDQGAGRGRRRRGRAEPRRQACGATEALKGPGSGWMGSAIRRFAGCRRFAPRLGAT